MKNHIKNTQYSNEELIKRLNVILYNIRMDWLYLTSLEDAKLVYDNRDLLKLENAFLNELEEKINSQKKDLSPLETQLCKKLIFWILE